LFLHPCHQPKESYSPVFRTLGTTNPTLKCRKLAQ
jgi:hypothetical protein